SMNFVLDCSVTMTWFFETEASAETDKLLDELSAGETAWVAQHWPLEVANVILGAEQRKKKTSAETARFLGLLDKLNIETDPETRKQVSGATITLARKHRLTSYDAAYLELAIRIGLPLASLD